MGKYIDDEFSRRAHKSGAMIGKTSPSLETKWTHWEVMSHEGRIIACVIGGMGFYSCAEEITPNELPTYCDDPNVARWAFENGADIRFHPTCTAGGPSYLAFLDGANRSSFAVPA